MRNKFKQKQIGKQCEHEKKAAKMPTTLGTMNQMDS